MSAIRVSVLGALLLAAPIQAQSPDPLAQASQLLERRQGAEARRILEPHAKANPRDARAAYLLGRACTRWFSTT